VLKDNLSLQILVYQLVAQVLQLIHLMFVNHLDYKAPNVNQINILMVVITANIVIQVVLLVLVVLIPIVCLVILASI